MNSVGYEGPHSGCAECWYIPEPDNLCVIKENGHLHVIGDEGPRPITNRELLRWTQFRIWLHRMEQE